MRYSVALAAIPVPVLVWAAWPAPSPLAPVKVVSEGVRAQRQDAGTFKMRWASVSELPPATILDRVAVDREQRAAAGEPSTAASSIRRRFVVRRVQLDVCARHKMRKVHYGKRWRCRR
ncbi:hypothetical protein EHM76_00255 [bacterium]|nr:MAG: hypothetical protein EHM76_00255 [bacterium]